MDLGLGPLNAGALPPNTRSVERITLSAAAPLSLPHPLLTRGNFFSALSLGKQARPSVAMINVFAIDFSIKVAKTFDRNYQDQFFGVGRFGFKF